MVQQLELAGVTEAAGILGVSKQRFDELRRTWPGFPRPVAELAAGPIWGASELRGFAETQTGRGPGQRVRVYLVRVELKLADSPVPDATRTSAFEASMGTLYTFRGQVVPSVRWTSDRSAEVDFGVAATRPEDAKDCGCKIVELRVVHDAGLNPLSVTASTADVLGDVVH